jgi:hypothetical protein
MSFDPVDLITEVKETKTKSERQENTPLKLAFFEELSKPSAKPWLIKNVIARGETSSWVAPPGKGKSALLTDISVCLAEVTDADGMWRGHRVRAQSGVVYFALERADLVKRRLVAHRLRDELPVLPIAVVGQVINLMDQGSVALIVDAIKRAEQRFGIEAGLAIFDTYSKGIAAGGGDESTARDQNTAVANLRRVIDKIGVHIATIGHTGKNESKGERGSNAHLADVDVQVQISGDTVKTVAVTKANDQPEGTLTEFQLEAYDFGVDEDGDPFRTFILGKERPTGIAAAGRKPTSKQQLAIEALAEVLLSHGRPAPSEYGLPGNIQVVDLKLWKEELLRRRVINPDGSNPRARHEELQTALLARRFVGVRDNVAWLPIAAPQGAALQG